jgi:hypothetical protein
VVSVIVSPIVSYGKSEAYKQFLELFEAMGYISDAQALIA